MTMACVKGLMYSIRSRSVKNSTERKSEYLRKEKKNQTDLLVISRKFSVEFTTKEVLRKKL